MGILWNSPEEELKICGVTTGDLSQMSNEQAIMLTMWRKYIADFGRDYLSAQLYRRATGRNEPD